MLRQLREETGLSQRDLAKQTGVVEAYLAQLETGAKKNPSFEVLKRLAKALQVKLTDLLE